MIDATSIFNDKDITESGDAGAGVDDKGDNNLHLAAEKGHLDIVQLLLCNADNFQKYGNFNEIVTLEALVGAAANGHVGVVQLLLQHLAFKEDVGAYGAKALVRAAANGHVGVVQLLLQHLAFKEDVGAEALVRAAENGHESIERLLSEHGFSISDYNKDRYNKGTVQGKRILNCLV